jgi:hypothetical protein
MRVLSITPPATGDARVNGDNTLTFTPTLGYSSTVTFQYTVGDDHGGSANAAVNITVVQVAACALYPIALHETTLTNVVAGQIIQNILQGSSRGNFGWLTWTGHNGVPALAASLTPPGNSSSYVNPNNANDHSVSLSDWVGGVPGAKNAKAVRDALDRLKTVDIVLPVWDQAKGQGANLQYRVSNFARVRIIDHLLPGQQQISVRFLGYTMCTHAQMATLMANGTNQGGADSGRETFGTPGHDHGIFLPLVVR